MILMTKKSKKVTSAITKTKKIMNIDDTDVNKILVSKKEQHGKYNHLHTLLDIIMLLDHYI